MTEEQLKKGNEIFNQLKEQKSMLERWERADRFSYSSIELGAGNLTTKVSTEDMNFRVIRALVIDELTKKVQYLETELKNI